MNPTTTDRKPTLWAVLLGLLALGVTAHASAPDTGAAAWDEWMRSRAPETSTPIVQNRQVTKTGRFQLLGPSAGFSDRRDFLSTWTASLGTRYHFNETHGWELLRITLAYSKESSLAQEIREQTSFRPDARQSRVQLGTAYVFTPIYGKYAWGSDALMYFDLFSTAGGGLRFSENLQPFLELGLGMNHYFGRGGFGLVPEYRLRFYPENRSEPVLVIESSFQLGISWML